MLNTTTTSQGIGRLSLILLVVVTASVSAWGQTASPQAAQDKNEAEAAAQTSFDPGDQATGQTAAKTAATTKQQRPPLQNGRSRSADSLLPLLFPFRVQQLDWAWSWLPAKFSNSIKTTNYLLPSTVGLVGAFTSSGSRGGGVGGRLYFSENKYQTTFALAKGRANFDFFGIGRIPGRDPISVPLKMGGTVFFGEFLRNIGRGIFVGPRYQRRTFT